MYPLIFVLIGLVLYPHFASAHEAYVLNHQFFWQHLSQPSNLQVFNALKNGHNILVTFVIALCVSVGLVGNYLFYRSRFGSKLRMFFETFAPYGPLFVRVAIAIALFISAQSFSFLGPELFLRQMPFAPILQILLYIVSVCIGLGFFTEIAACIALIIFCIGFLVFGAYLITYLNYLGEFIVLLMFGMRTYSLDGLLFGRQKRFQILQKYEVVIVRVCYGLSLIFAAVVVKLLHPSLTLQVVNQWNLTQFHWLFPSDPLLVTLGAGLVEAAMGVFIILGFQLRLTVLISLFYITLSLLYFRELVWPHLMLYGISFSLLVQPNVWSLDQYLLKRTDK